MSSILSVEYYATIKKSGVDQNQERFRHIIYWTLTVNCSQSKHGQRGKDRKRDWPRQKLQRNCHIGPSLGVSDYSSEVSPIHTQAGTSITSCLVDQSLEATLERTISLGPRAIPRAASPSTREDAPCGPCCPHAPCELQNTHLQLQAALS
jgi:hypothetical protein